MPPKNASKGGNQPGKKTDQKKKERLIEDKTFGLKNKKGGKQQKFIQQVQKQVTHGGNKPARLLDKDDPKLKKDLKRKELQEINDLFKPVQQQLAKGVDPKSVLCSFFKNGQCTKGNKCKFSHDLTIERKAEKRSAYVDVRDDKETSEYWDEETLKEVVEQKHGNESTSKATSTQIICKFFLDAVEAGKYGWFWECPNGEKCIYRHALPSGYVLKKDRKRSDREEEISLEDLIERERAALGRETIKVTLETFLAWKKQKLKEKEEKEKKDMDKKKNDYRSGKECGISGREMFIFNPDLADNQDMEEEGDADFDFKHMKREPEDGEEEEEEIEIHYKEIDLNAFMDEYRDIDSNEPSASVVKPNRLDHLELEPSTKLAMENGLSKGGGAVSKCEGAVAIDEDLFEGDDEDLQDLEDQLEEMAVTS